MQDLTPKQAYDLITLIQDVKIIDVRTPEEFQLGRIDNAVNMNFYEPNFNSNILQLDPSFFYVIYCRTGSRSAIAARHLSNNNFEEVYNISGGFVEWINSELPFVD